MEFYNCPCAIEATLMNMVKLINMPDITKYLPQLVLTYHQPEHHEHII